jgi:sugar/nucleoside kinase (ribokinase family)
LKIQGEKTAINLKIGLNNRKEENGFDAIIVGHFSLDTNIWPTGQIKNALGGAPTYAGSAFAALHKRVGVFSIIGKDHYSEALSFCQAKGIDTQGLLVSSNETMVFQNLYTADGNRKQRCSNIAPKLSFRDLPKNYLASKAFYISPLAGEVDEEFIGKLKIKESIIMLDPQGLMRNANKEGEVSTIFRKSKLERIFKLVDIVKIGKDEVKAFKMEEKRILNTLKKIGVKVTIITRGRDDVMIFYSRKIYKVKTLDVKVEDPTGAGDVFGATFLSEYINGSTINEAIKFATISAGLKIRYEGPNGFPSKKDIIKHL